MKTQKPIMPRLCIGIGAGLLILAIAGLLLWQGYIRTSARQAEACVSTLRTLIPEPQGATLEERRDNTMSVLSVEGVNFAGILEMPKYGSALPVSAEWGSSWKYPSRFTGSIYDRTMQIGATSQAGQYDFYREISVGDTLYFTDMEGNRYTYTVTALHYEKHADQAALQQTPADLTLFIKNIYAFEYLLVSCEICV